MAKKAGSLRRLIIANAARKTVIQLEFTISFGIAFDHIELYQSKK
jgi:hypothetical protein